MEKEHSRESRNPDMDGAVLRGNNREEGMIMIFKFGHLKKN